MKQLHDHDNPQHGAKIQNQNEILAECCRDQVQAVILTLNEERVYYHARMISVSGDSLSLRLRRKLIKAAPPGSTCYFSFPHQNRLSFFSKVLEYHHNSPDRHAELILDIRSGFMRSESRLAYRVNVTPASHLVVSLATDDGLIWSPRAVDLSLTGIGIDFAQERSHPKLEVGSRVDLEMRLPPDKVRLKGEVRHGTGLKYGISFSAALTKAGVRPSLALKHIVSSLEREWMRHIIPNM